MNKREFVRAAGAAAAFGAGLPAMAATPSPEASGDMAAWQQRVGERFALYGTASPVTLSLARVQAHASTCSRTEQFSLIFEVQGPVPTDGTQVLRQAGARPSALYLVQGGAAADGTRLMRADCSQLV